MMNDSIAFFRLKMVLRALREPSKPRPNRSTMACSEIVDLSRNRYLTHIVSTENIDRLDPAGRLRGVKAG